MAQDPWYREWFNSPYYHLLYFERSQTEAVAFIHRLIQHLKPPPGARMLDIASGKGRHAMALADLGYDVTGIDLSPYMTAEARQHERDNLHFYQHDMRLPFWINYFHYAFNFFTSFGYFSTRREHEDAVRTIANSLVPGGIFVMDYLNVHYAENHLVYREQKEIDQILFYITRWMDEDFFYKKIEIEDERLDTPLTFTEKVAKFGPGDFTEIFAYQQIQIEELYGDYQLGPYKLMDSPRIIMICRKKGA